MTDKTQPEALALADEARELMPPDVLKLWAAEATGMIRRQHARIAELEAQLEAVGAGGVQALSAPPAEQPIGEVVVTKTKDGQIVSVTRQDDEGRILSVIATSGPVEQTSITPETGNPASAKGAAITSESGAVYAGLPAPNLPRGGFPDLFTEGQMRDFADRTHAARLRCKSEQARLATLWGYVRADATTKQAAPKAAPGEPCYLEKWDAELGRTAMRFVDRAGDVHPGIDDAATICAEFHKAMSEVIERMPHVQRMAAPQQEALPTPTSADGVDHG